MRFRVRKTWVLAGAILFFMGGAGRTSVLPLGGRVSAGCLAVNSGALDLKVEIRPIGLTIGAMGSPIVGGFQKGDVLTIVVNARAGSAPMRHNLNLAAFDRAGVGLISRVLSLSVQLAPGNQFSDAGKQFVVPADADRLELFISSSGEGEGEYVDTIRCKPSSDAVS